MGDSHGSRREVSITKLPVTRGDDKQSVARYCQLQLTGNYVGYLPLLIFILFLVVVFDIVKRH